MPGQFYPLDRLWIDVALSPSSDGISRIGIVAGPPDYIGTVNGREVRCIPYRDADEVAEHDAAIARGEPWEPTPKTASVASATEAP